MWIEGGTNISFFAYRESTFASEQLSTIHVLEPQSLPIYVIANASRLCDHTRQLPDSSLSTLLSRSQKNEGHCYRRPAFGGLSHMMRTLAR
jgi:hypothetical protein